MKKKNISLCAITATLFFGNHANAGALAKTCV